MTSRELFTQNELLYFKESWPKIPREDAQKIIDVYFEWGDLNGVTESTLLAHMHFLAWLFVVLERRLNSENANKG